MSPLYAELNRWLRVPYQWGENDCITLCADWVLRMRGVDPAADLRLTYGTMGECQRVTGFFTDPMPVIAPRMDRAGLSRTDAPVPGDVGLLLLPDGRGAARPYGGLCLGKQWASKMIEGGVLSNVPFKILAAWSVGYENP